MASILDGIPSTCTRLRLVTGTARVGHDGTRAWSASTDECGTGLPPFMSSPAAAGLPPRGAPV